MRGRQPAPLRHAANSIGARGIGSDRESSIAQAQNDRYDGYVYDLEHAACDVRQLSEYLMWTVDRRAVAASGSTFETRRCWSECPPIPVS